MKIYLVTWLEDNQGATLTKVGSRNRLMSFFFLKDTERNFLKRYIRTGLGGGKVDGNKEREAD